MFKYWSKIFTIDCCVFQIKNKEFVYPIFKNGSTSLAKYVEENQLKIFKNQEISKLSNIVVFLRDPKERFFSGVNTYLEFEKIQDPDKEIEVLKKIEKLKIYDRHFIPQYYWLMHLFKYYRGDVILKSVSDLYKLIPNRDMPFIRKLTEDRKRKIQSLDYKKYIMIDNKIIKKYIDKTINLKDLIKEFKNAVS